MTPFYVPTFKIRFTKAVVFSDCHGAVIKAYLPGDTCDATAKTDTYFVTAMGGIFFDEAVELSPN